jgi:hypothetical protein
MLRGKVLSALCIVACAAAASYCSWCFLATASGVVYTASSAAIALMSYVCTQSGLIKPLLLALLAIAHASDVLVPNRSVQSLVLYSQSKQCDHLIVDLPFRRRATTTAKAFVSGAGAAAVLCSSAANKRYACFHISKHGLLSPALSTTYKAAVQHSAIASPLLQSKHKMLL